MREAEGGQSSRENALAELIAIHEVVAIGKLNAVDLFGTVLDFKVGLEQFDIHELSFLRVSTIGASKVKGKVTIMGFDETIHGAQHVKDIALGVAGNGISNSP